MSVATLVNIETAIDALSVDERLRLIERLVRSIRKDTQPDALSYEQQLAAMAADPDIQRELREIEEEFSVAEGDGLGDV